MSRRTIIVWPLALAVAWSVTATAMEDNPAGADPRFDASAGEHAWVQQHRPDGSDGPRSCATCHGTDLTQPGRHATTGRAIEPMARSVNRNRLSDPAKAEKWFGRNCRWTLGRDCTPREKGDFAQLIQSR